MSFLLLTLSARNTSILSLGWKVKGGGASKQEHKKQASRTKSSREEGRGREEGTRGKAG